MAHVRQELALGLVGGLRRRPGRFSRLLGCFELGRLCLYRTFRRFQLPVLGFDLCAGALGDFPRFVFFLQQLLTQAFGFPPFAQVERASDEGPTQPSPPEPEALVELGVEPERRPSFAAWKGTGCDRCRSTGYLGRTGVFELLPVDEEMRSLVLAKAPASQIKQRAVAQGMQTLLADGRDKVGQGRTTIEEVLHVCQRDDV